MPFTHWRSPLTVWYFRKLGAGLRRPTYMTAWARPHSLAQSAGSVSDSYSYDSFGNSIHSSGSTVNAIRYVGRLGYQLDPDLSQFYLRARYYDPLTGQLHQPRPPGNTRWGRQLLWIRRELSDAIRRSVGRSSWPLPPALCVGIAMCEYNKTKCKRNPKAFPAPAPNTAYFVSCSGGKLSITSVNPSSDSCVSRCQKEHEEEHITYLTTICPTWCACILNEGMLPGTLNIEECDGYDAELDCLFRVQTVERDPKCDQARIFGHSTGQGRDEKSELPSTTRTRA